MITHSVYGNSAILRRSQYNMATRAHTEGIYSSAGGKIILTAAIAQLIFCRRQTQFFHALQQGLTPVQQAQADAYFAILQRNIDAELARLDESGPVTGKAGT